MKTRQCMVPEIWSVTERIFFSFWTIFCPFTSLFDIDKSTFSLFDIDKKLFDSLTFDIYLKVQNRAREKYKKFKHKT